MVDIDALTIVGNPEKREHEDYAEDGPHEVADGDDACIPGDKMVQRDNMSQ